MRPVIQSFKKVINSAPVSQAAGSRTIVFTAGVDSVAAGQTGPTDGNVPTGSIIKSILIQISLAQIVGGAIFAHYSIQRTHSGQVTIASNIIGGSPQRNQVHHQEMQSIGQDQNWNRSFLFKIPKAYQRVREGDSWNLEITTSGTIVQAFQFIYKFYR